MTKVIMLIVFTHVNSGSVISQIGPFMTNAECQQAYAQINRVSRWIYVQGGTCVWVYR